MKTSETLIKKTFRSFSPNAIAKHVGHSVSSIKSHHYFWIQIFGCLGVGLTASDKEAYRISRF